MDSPRYDKAKPRKALRSGRDKGVRIFVPAMELARAGFMPEDTLTYRVWGSKKGVTIRFYKEKKP